MNVKLEPDVLRHILKFSCWNLLFRTRQTLVFVWSNVSTQREEVPLEKRFNVYKNINLWNWELIVKCLAPVLWRFKHKNWTSLLLRGPCAGKSYLLLKKKKKKSSFTYVRVMCQQIKTNSPLVFLRKRNRWPKPTSDTVHKTYPAEVKPQPRENSTIHPGG